MPAVFVHGNPETPAIWDQLFAHLTRKDVIALSPPGFGDAMRRGYRARHAPPETRRDHHLARKIAGQVC